MQLSMSCLSPDRNDRGTRVRAPIRVVPASYRCLRAFRTLFDQGYVSVTSLQMQGRNERNTGINPSFRPSSALFPPFIPASLLFFFFLPLSQGVSPRFVFFSFFFSTRNLLDTPRWITVVPFNLRLMENAGWMEIRG